MNHQVTQAISPRKRHSHLLAALRSLNLEDIKLSYAQYPPAIGMIRWSSREKVLFKIISKLRLDILLWIYENTPQYFFACKEKKSRSAARKRDNKNSGKESSSLTPLVSVLNRKDPFSKSIARKGDLEMLKLWRRILQKLAHLSGKFETIVPMKPWSNTDILYTACERGRLDMMEWIHYSIDNQLIPKFSGSQISILYVALSGGHIQCADWILSVDPSALEKEISISKWGMIQLGTPSVVEWIHSKNPSIVPSLIGTELMISSIRKGNLGLMKSMHTIDSSLLYNALHSNGAKNVAYFMTKKDDFKCYDQLIWIHSVDPSLMSKLTFSGMNIWELAVYYDKPVVELWVRSQYPLFVSSDIDSNLCPLRPLNKYNKSNSALLMKQVNYLHNRQSQ